MTSNFYDFTPRILFIDMNSFFASVEQQERPALRNSPLIVAPMLSDTTCAISVSYQARIFGIKTGTSVREAKQLCPHIQVIAARPRKYVEYCRKIVELLHYYFVTIEELSVDEMACVLPPSKRSIESATILGERVKTHIKQSLGEALRCSIGIAPNVFLAKVASDFKKPDGLTLFVGDYTDKLFSLSLTDLPGIAKRNEQRLQGFGIYTVKDLWEAELSTLRSVWGGTVGERWHYMLRGNLQIDYGVHSDAPKKSVSHSHVLAPELRTIQGARDMLLRLAEKALKRLRAYNQIAKTISCRISFRHVRSWEDKRAWEMKHSYPVYANDDLCWLPIIDSYSGEIKMGDDFRPVKASVCFYDLQSKDNEQLSLFEDRSKYTKLFKLIDSVKEKTGCEVHVAQVLNLQEHAPFRISFGKTGGGNV